MILFVCCVQIHVYGSVEWNLPPIQISHTSQGDKSWEPVIATNGIDTVIAVWVQDGAIYGSEFNVRSLQWSDPDKIGSENDKDPRVVIVAPHKAIVTFKSRENLPYNLKGCLYIPGSSPITESLTWVDDVDDQPYSVVAYKDGTALIAYSEYDSSNIRVGVYVPSIAPVETWNIISTYAPPAADGISQRLYPFLAIQPHSNIPFIVWTQSNRNDSAEIVGAALPTIENPPAAAFTVFTAGNLNHHYNYPQIFFDPADSSPVVFYGSKQSNNSIVASVWTNPFIESHFSTVNIINNYDVISSETLVDDANLFFNVAVNKPHFFTVIYRQNVAYAKVYGTYYIPGSNSPTNDQISVHVSAHNNVYNAPKIVNIPTNASVSYNIITWEQINKLYGAIYAPQISFFVSQQLSSNGDGSYIDGNALSLCQNNKIAAVWSQGASDDVRQIFGVSGLSRILSGISNIQKTRQINMFPGCCDVINSISWQSSDMAASYTIYRAPNMSDPIAYGRATSDVTVKDYCRNLSTKDVYCIYEADLRGNYGAATWVSIP